jgi:hypothetical protein
MHPCVVANDAGYPPTKRVKVAGGHRLFHPQIFQGAQVEREFCFLRPPDRSGARKSLLSREDFLPS